MKKTLQVFIIAGFLNMLCFNLVYSYSYTGFNYNAGYTSNNKIDSLKLISSRKHVSTEILKDVGTLGSIVLYNAKGDNKRASFKKKDIKLNEYNVDYVNTSLIRNILTCKINTYIKGVISFIYNKTLIKYFMHLKKKYRIIYIRLIGKDKFIGKFNILI